MLLALFLTFCVTHTYWMVRPDPLIWFPGAFVLGYCMGRFMGMWENYHARRQWFIEHDKDVVKL